MAIPAAQPTSPSHPQPHQYQGQRPSRGWGFGTQLGNGISELPKDTAYHFSIDKSDNCNRQTLPSSVTAKRLVPLTARHWTSVAVNPELTAVQLLPLFLEMKTPLDVPIKRFFPLVAKHQT
ncbi:MAG: hypothetical protein GTN73_05600 [Candidatus Aminicenantes bacterium]|nr:hypothetical protein [Candidatus Aminicenantes bacterium]